MKRFFRFCFNFDARTQRNDVEREAKRKQVFLIFFFQDFSLASRVGSSRFVAIFGMEFWKNFVRSSNFRQLGN